LTPHSLTHRSIDNPNIFFSPKNPQSAKRIDTGSGHRKSIALCQATTQRPPFFYQPQAAPAASCAGAPRPSGAERKQEPLCSCSLRNIFTTPVSAGSREKPTPYHQAITAEGGHAANTRYASPRGRQRRRRYSYQEPAKSVKPLNYHPKILAKNRKIFQKSKKK